jgi:hypothetical protein
MGTRLISGRFASKPPKPLPLLPPAEVAAYSSWLKPKGPPSPTADAPTGDRVSTTAPARITRAGATTITVAMRISAGPIFFPRYWGERPTIRLATNTASTVNPISPARPVPAPPPTTSPNPMNTSGTRVPMGVMPTREAFDEPLAVAVVKAVHKAEAPTPMRTSLPSMLPAAWPRPPVYTEPSAATRRRDESVAT